MPTPSQPGSPHHPARFATTRWSVVLAAGGEDDSSKARDALATLCEAYWYPLYAFVRRRGHKAEEAQDLTQAFFARMLEKHFLRDVHPELGRFRSFLLACLKHFLSNEREKARALKRGGGLKPISIDSHAAEQRYRLEPADDETPEKLFERQWAVTLLSQTLSQLEAEAERDGRGELFAQLKVYLTGEQGPSYAEVAARFDMTEDAVKAAVYRLRKRYRKCLREQIAQTVADEEQVEQEIQDLFAALG